MYNRLEEVYMEQPQGFEIPKARENIWLHLLGNSLLCILIFMEYMK
jgi:hypothetical protein